jgi:hypothetical protein
MKRSKLLLLALMVSTTISFAQHWKPLPLHFDWNSVTCIPDVESDSIFIIGQFFHVNGISADMVKWDGDSGITPMNLFNGGGGFVDDVTTYQGKLFVSAGATVYRKDDTGLYATNDPRFKQAGGFVRFGDRLVTMMEYYDAAGKWAGMHWDVWDGMNWKDTLRYDTLWPGQTWGASSVASYKGELYVGGNINPSNHPSFREILRFDGTRWKDVGGGIRANGLGYVSKLLVWKGDLYACGSFDENDGAPGNGIARWDGSAWHRLGEGLWKASGTGAGVQEMAVYNDELYAVGLFDHAGDVATNGIAKWDGRKWCVVHDTFENGTQSQIISYKGKLFIGGSWSSINGDSSFSYLAKWAGGTFGDTCSLPLSVANTYAPQGIESIYPNPTKNRVFTKVADVKVVVIIDATGRTVMNSAYSVNGIDVSELPEGIYVVRLIGPRVVQRAKLIRRN